MAEIMFFTVGIGTTGGMGGIGWPIKTSLFELQLIVVAIITLKKYFYFFKTLYCS